MITTRLHHRSSRSVFIVAIVVMTLLSISRPLSAQVYIDPTGPAVGGRSATPLDTSATTQQKLGSLLIGQTGLPASRICLNGTGNLVGGDDASPGNPGGHCVTSWANVVNSLGAPFVDLVKTAPSGAAGNISSYNAPNSGYARLKASGPGTASTFLTEANNAVGAGTTTALYASTGYIEDYAGYFSGKFSIEPTAINRGRLCLNSTCNYNAGDPACQNLINNFGYYCVSDWSQIISNTNDRLSLQTSVSPTIESGTVLLKEGFSAGAAVIGVPPSTTPLGTTVPFCGDGLCSREIHEDQSGNANYCALDCETIPLPNNVTAQTITFGIGVTVTPTAIASSNTPYFLVVRSSNPSFVFEPQDGVKYKIGGNSTFAIVYAVQRPNASPFTFLDTAFGMIANKVYTYHVYEANPYPRYLKVASGSGFNYTSVTATAGPAAVGTGPEESPDGGDIQL